MAPTSRKRQVLKAKVSAPFVYVVNAKRQVRRYGHGHEVLEHLPVGKRSVGDGCQQQSIRPRILGIPRKFLRVIRAESADTDDERYATTDALSCSHDCPSPLRPRQVGVGTGATEQPIESTSASFSVSDWSLHLDHDFPSALVSSGGVVFLTLSVVDALPRC